MGQRILVTGGAGYVGSQACKLFAAAGYEPVTFDNLSTGFDSQVKWGPLVVGDLHDTSLIQQTLVRIRPVAVVHFAAHAYVGESTQLPLKYYRNNVSGTVSLLTAMAAADVRTLVFSSTCATYGIPATSTLAESHPQAPVNPYGRTKLMIESILSDLDHSNQVRFVALRYFNAAGADPDGEIGERHDPETHLIPLAIRAALGGAVLKVFGTDFPTPDGTAVRDYVHVWDLATAHLAALEHLLGGGRSEFINLGIGRGYSVRDIVDALGSLGLTVPTIDAPRRAGDPAILVADAAKARAVLKWKPRYDRLDELLRTAVAWHRANG